MTGLEPPPRIIKPRNRKYKHLPVIAISNGQWVDENGETGPVSVFEHKLPAMQSTLFVKLSAADFIAELDKYFTEWNNSWQWRASVNERDIVHPSGLRVAARMSVLIHYFGFKNGNYHKIIDPVSMYGKGLDDIWPGEEPRITKLLQWGIALRNFCHKNGIEVRPTIGGISAQFLTDKRFYPRNRRKVPAAINQRAREHLPGNHYALFTAPTRHREFSAWYIDQSRAHHYHARTTTLPDANSLYAHGRFIDLEGIAFGRTVPGFHGLYCLDITQPVNGLLTSAKTDKQFVFSNELQYLLDTGYTVRGVRAAWGSTDKDSGLARYSRWACKQLDHYGDSAWIKPLLLSTYGTLATRPRVAETVFKMARSGQPVSLVTGNNELSGLMVKGSHRLEPRIANVLHRGMIEAATRMESIGCAEWLTSEGFKVLSIYADAIIVENDGTRKLPLLPEPWRVKAELNHLQFINHQAFISGEMTKLPGISGEARDVLKRTPLMSAGTKPANKLKSLRQIQDERYDYYHGNVR